MNDAELHELRAFIGMLDPPHLNYAKAYAETLQVGDPMPSQDGLEAELCAQIRIRLRREWRARVSARRRRDG